MKFAIVVTVVLFIELATAVEPDRNQLKEVYYWDFVDYEIPAGRREQAIASRSFIPNLNGIWSLGVWHDKMFVGVHRFRQGTLSSLNYFPLNTTSKSPLLTPYPSFEANYVNEDPNNLTISLPSQSSVINAGHFKIDKCDRLWLVDVGYTDYWGAKRVIAPPALVIFDLNTDTLLRRFVIPKEFINPVAVLLNLDIDMENDSCEDVHAYIVDSFRSIIVYSYKKDRAWQVEHSFMGSDPHEVNFFYEGLNFQWNYGIFSIAVGEKKPDGSKQVYFAPVASTTMYSVSNRVLQDETYKQARYYYDFNVMGNIGKDGHAAQIVYDEQTNVLINLLYGRSTISCWNTRLPYHIATIHKTSELFFPTGVTIDADRNLWILSNRLPLYFYEEFKPDVKNIRVFKEIVEKSLMGTNCYNKPKSE